MIPHERDWNIALHEVLRLLVDTRSEFLRASNITMDFDNKATSHAVTNGRAQNELMHSSSNKLMQTSRASYHGPSGETSGADKRPRWTRNEHVQLHQSNFNGLWTSWENIAMHLMVSTASPQRAPTTNGMPGSTFPFYSRICEDGIVGVDVLAQNVSRIPCKEILCFGFCPSPPSMVGVFISHAQTCRTHAVVVAQGTRVIWFPLMESATVRCSPVGDQGLS